MEKHLGTRYELQAEDRDSRVFLDPGRAGAAFFDARREDMPRLVQFDINSRDGTVTVPQKLIAETERGANGALAHVFGDVSAEVRAGYDAAAQRASGRAVPVHQAALGAEAEAPGPALPQPPVMELSHNEHFVMEREAQPPLTYGNARQAGAAFYSAPVEDKPRLLHVAPGQEPREVGHTSPTVGVHTDLGLYVHPNKQLVNETLLDAAVRDGYFGAMERSVNAGLAVTDWHTATKGGFVPVLDKNLYRDLQDLTMNYREVALQAWAENAPTDVRRPTFIDLATGQIATLDRTADMQTAKEVQRLVYGEVKVLVPPLYEHAAHLAPDHAAAQMPAEWKTPQAAPAAAAPKGPTMSEQQQPQQPEAKQKDHAVRVGDSTARLLSAYVKEPKEPGGQRLYTVEVYGAKEGEKNRLLFQQHDQPLDKLDNRLRADTREVLQALPEGTSKLEFHEKQWTPKAEMDRMRFDRADRVTFSKTNALEGPQYTARAWGEGNRLLAEVEKMPADKLAERMGDRWAAAVQERAVTTRTGTITAAQLDAPEQGKAAAAPAKAQKAPAKAARAVQEAAPAKAAKTKATPAKPAEVVNSIEPVTERAQQVTPEAATLKTGADLTKALAAADLLTVDKPPAGRGPFPMTLRGMSAEKDGPDGWERSSQTGMGVVNTRAELDQAVGEKRAEQLIADPRERIEFQRVPQRDVQQTVQPAAAPAAEALQPWSFKNGMHRLLARLQQDRGQPVKLPPAAPQTPAQTTQQATAAPVKEAAAQAAPALPLSKEAQREALMKSLYDRFDVRGNDFLFKGEAGRVAFTDHGKQLSSKLDAPAVVRSMTDMIQAKGWEGVKINGTPEFMRSTWREATLRRIDVKGYEPTAEDRKWLVEAKHKQAQEKQQGSQAAKDAPAQQRSGNTMEQAQPAQQGREAQSQQAVQQKPRVKAPAQQKAAAPGQAVSQDTKREQAMNAMRSYLGAQKLDPSTVNQTLKDFGAHIDKAIAQGKAVPTVQVADPTVQRTAAPVQAVVPQAAQERAAPAR